MDNRKERNSTSDNYIDSSKPKRTNRGIYIIYILLGMFVSIYLSVVRENVLNSIIPNLGFLAPIIIISVWAGLGTWLLTGQVTTWYLFKTPITRLLSVVLIMAIIWLGMPLYVDYLPQKSTIEFERPYYDSTQVLVRYGTRENDFFWTQKTIGELKQKSSVALKVNGYDIFNIYTDGRQIIVDAILFAGYGNQIVNDYTTIGSTNNFTIEMSGYFNTDAVGYPKYFQRKTQSTEIKNKVLAQPVRIINNALDREIKGWKIWKSSVGFEVTNENNIPVLVMEYKNPHTITISGLFATPMGILKVDNSKDTIFEFGDSPFELREPYKVDRIRPRSVFDLFNPARVYILSDKGR